jgi:hypothetical protein
MNILIGDGHFQRDYDDQIGITVPAAMLASNQSWLMSDHDISLEIFHSIKWMVNLTKKSACRFGEFRRVTFLEHFQKSMAAVPSPPNADCSCDNTKVSHVTP